MTCGVLHAGVCAHVDLAGVTLQHSGATSKRAFFFFFIIGGGTAIKTPQKFSTC